MPFNASGVFQRVRNWVADATAGVKIRADFHDAEDDGFALGLSECITRSGLTTITQNIPWNSKRITGLADPVNPQDASTKAYADTKLDKTGGVMTGPITATTITASGAITAASVTASGAITAATVTAGTLFLNGANYSQTDGTNHLIRSNGTIRFQNSTGGGDWGYIAANGLFMQVGGITTPGLITGSGLSVGGSGVVSTGPISSNYSPFAFYCGSTANSIGAVGGNPGNFGQVGYHIIADPGKWWGAEIRIVSAASFYFRHDANAYKTGGSTAWIIESDARIKDVTGDYTSGLAAIAALRPVRYTFKGNDAATRGKATIATEHIGLVAQEAEVSMPETVLIGKGTIDGVEVDDLRSLDSSPIVFALINAVKELKARGEELEARVAQLEAV